MDPLRQYQTVLGYVLVHLLNAVAHDLDVVAGHHLGAKCILLHEVLQSVLRSVIFVQRIHHYNAVRVDSLRQYQTVLGDMLVHLLDTVTHVLDVVASHHLGAERIFLHEVLQSVLRSVIFVQCIHHRNAVRVDSLRQYQTVLGYVFVHLLNAVTHGLDVTTSHHLGAKCILLHEVLQSVLRCVVFVQRIHHHNAVRMDAVGKSRAVQGQAGIHLIDAVAHHHDHCAVAGKVTILSDQGVNLISCSVLTQCVIQVSVGSEAVLLNQSIDLVRCSITT